MTDETPIAAGEAMKVNYAQKKGGTFITFKLSENPDDNFSGLVDLNLGDPIRLYVTKAEIGI